jgi:hypothetical protein
MLKFLQHEENLGCIWTVFRKISYTALFYQITFRSQWASKLKWSRIKYAVYWQIVDFKTVSIKSKHENTAYDANCSRSAGYWWTVCSASVDGETQEIWPVTAAWFLGPKVVFTLLVSKTTRWAHVCKATHRSYFSDPSHCVSLAIPTCLVRMSL